MRYMYVNKRKHLQEHKHGLNIEDENMLDFIKVKKMELQKFMLRPNV